MNSLDANSLAAGFAKQGLSIGLHVYDQLPSTQEFLKTWIASEGTADPAAQNDVQLCICDWQTQGSGRRGRSWNSQPGNITFSLLTDCSRNPNELMGLSLVTGICLCETIRELTGLDVRAKWPNDVIIEDKKLAGILVDVLPSMAHQRIRIVTGIGINYQEEESRLEPLGMGGTSLSAHGDILPGRDELLIALVGNLLAAYNEFDKQGWQAFTKRWDALDYLKDRAVDIERQQGDKLVGRAAGVASDGALLVESNGNVTSYHNAEISVRLQSVSSDSRN